MKLMLHAAALSLLLGLACHQPDVVVRTAAGEQAAVSRYSTFSFVLPDPKDMEEAGLDPQVLQRFAVMSVEELKGRGYHPVGAEHAEVLVAVSPFVNEYNTERVDMDKSGRENSQFDSSMRASGMLTVSFVDAKSKQIVFQRVAEARLLQTGPSDERMHEAVTELYAGIPAPTNPVAAPPAAVAAPGAAPASAPAPAASAAPPDPEEPQATETSATPKR